MRQLGIFAKYWEPGKVKTRLASSFDEAFAASCHQHFLTTLLNRARDSTVWGDRKVLAFSPPDKREAFEEIAGDPFIVQPQSEGDLGQRMVFYFEQALNHPGTKAILLGSDSPDLPEEYLQTAWEKLDQVPVVLGEAEDGGYYLIGLQQMIEPIFHDMPWSQPNLLDYTVERLKKLGVEYHLLPAWYDVDEQEDLARLAISLKTKVDREEAESWERSLWAVLQMEMLSWKNRST
ncbi:Glycosyltransferase [Planctomycetales bacterium 10988]|nr:Glycosyltransferase [Planctomycetales bacterium 10988]